MNREEPQPTRPSSPLSSPDDGLVCPACDTPFDATGVTVGSLSACTQCQRALLLTVGPLAEKAGAKDASADAAGAAGATGAAAAGREAAPGQVGAGGKGADTASGDPAAGPAIQLVKPEELPGELVHRYQVISRIPLSAPGMMMRVKPRGVAREYALEWGLVAGEQEPGRAGRGGLPAEWSGALAHENLLLPVSAGAVGRHRFVVTEIPEGQTLAQLLETPGTLAIDRVIEIAFQIARALAHLHRHGLVHRDVKPSAVVVDPTGRMRLAGLGLVTTAGMRSPRLLPGTPAYCPPELVRGQPCGPGADVYAFGALLYQMLAGRRPLKRRSVRGLLIDALEVDPTPVREFRPGVPPALDKLASRCLAKGPGLRPADGMRLLQELAVAARETGSPEPVELPVVDARARAAAEVRPSLPLVAFALPGACLLGSVLCLVASQWLWLDPEGRALGGVALVAALAVLARALTAFARRTTGDGDAWWRPYLSDDAVEGFAPAARLGAPIGALACVVGGLALVRLSPLLLWTALLVTGLPGAIRAGRKLFIPAAVSLQGPLAQGQSELMVEGEGDGWMYRLADGSGESLLPRRLWLRPGPVRIELWRPGGRRRTFLLYGPERASHLVARAAERDDGPSLMPARQAARGA